VKISITARDIKYDAKGFITVTFKSMREQMLAAAQDFLLAALPKVPIVTGMARGSYLNMLQLLDKNGLKGADDLVPTVAPASGRLKNGHYRKYIHSDGEVHAKQPETAKQFSTSRGQIITRVGDKISFQYNIDVVHYNIMDEFNPYGGSWRSIRRGKEAFINRLGQFKSPNVSKYLIVSRQTFGTRGDGTQTVLRTQKTVK
jgi:hypothetical protein